MEVAEAIATRRSVRVFLDKPVDEAVIRRVLEAAARSPSGGNMQPWRLHLFAGEPLRALKQSMSERLADTGRKETPGYDIYPRELHEPYRSRTFAVGEAMYASMNIAREDKPARRAWFAKNFAFFDAPVGLFCYTHKIMGPPQWSDLGMFLQTLMLLLKDAGLDSCSQECWALYPETVRGFTGAAEDYALFCGMAIGYRDPTAAVNSFPQSRVPVDEFATLNWSARA